MKEYTTFMDLLNGMRGFYCFFIEGQRYTVHVTVAWKRNVYYESCDSISLETGESTFKWVVNKEPKFNELMDFIRDSLQHEENMSIKKSILCYDTTSTGIKGFKFNTPF